MTVIHREFVRLRAQNRCEYCHIPDCDLVLRPFCLEHVIARKHGGGDEDANAAWACAHCNECKGPNLTGIDPETGSLERIFDPRRHNWDEHFEIQDGTVIGLTAMGRVTVRVLRMNDLRWAEIRKEAIALTEDDER